jgi:probable rRNA maturation factor
MSRATVGRRRARPLRFEVVDRGRPRTDPRFLRRVVRATLQFVGRPDLQVSLLITGDAEIAALHAEYFRDPSPTDVISFALDDGAELVVSRDTARRCAREHGHSIRAELALYVVHGILHTTGYDDVRARDRARMRAAEQVVLHRLRLRVRPVDA